MVDLVAEASGVSIGKAHAVNRAISGDEEKRIIGVISTAARSCVITKNSLRLQSG